ncbi:MAG: AI-2E family transporter [Sphingomicrobium sp.]
MNGAREPDQSDLPFIRRTLIVIGLLACAFLVWELRYVLILLFGSVLVATIIRSIAQPFKAHLRLPDGLAVAISVLLIAAAVGVTFWLISSQISAQTAHLADALPKSVTMVDSWLAGLGLDHPLETWISHVRSDNSVIVANFGGWLSTLTLALASLLILVFGGIFLAAQPRFYGIGAIKLIPPEKRALIAEAMEESAVALRLWLKGQLVAMVAIGILTWIGFLIIGVQSPLVLAIVAGILEFVPYAGPIASAIPAVLVALVQGPELAAWTVVMYVVVHHLEAYVLQPVVQQWAVEVPAVVMLFSLLAFGLLFGIVGVLFAAPLAVVTYVLVKRLYVVEALDTPTPIPGEGKA